jgi:phosphoribosylaminoimidazole-succinocarboxamide synthase
MEALIKNSYNFTGQTKHYVGKVRDVYSIGEDLLVMVVSDRLSAFDVVLPKGIPFKGQVLNQIAQHFLNATSDIIPNWLEATPDPIVSVGKKAVPFKVEMVIRGYMSGHAARTYNSGTRVLCGVNMPDGMKENQKFPEPIITPTTKADVGHDEDISRENILSLGIVSEADYLQLENYTRLLFQRGTEMANKMGLILVDTKYEFGKDSEENIILIDEIHTPDSSRYFYQDGYEDRLEKDDEQKQLSKEFVRKWLIENGFEGKEGQDIPFMTEEFIQQISDRYIELFESIVGEKFVKAEVQNIEVRVFDNVEGYLKSK